MKSKITYSAALKFATEKHRGQIRKEGIEYITHPVAVAELLKKLGYDIEYQITGLFHDLLEDTDVTDQEILSLSNDDVLKAVKLLTKYKGYIMDDYINNLKNNRIACVVKLADRLHNLISAGVADEKFIRKYIKDTEDYYIQLSTGTEFEDDIKKVVEKLKIKLKE